MSDFSQTFQYFLSSTEHLVTAIVTLLILAVVVVALILVIIDVRQHRDAVRHNYPLLGRFRNFFMHMGIFFRAYFFAEDREELPFNRAERQWVRDAAANHNLEGAFGSTRTQSVAGSYVFINAPFPPLDRTSVAASAITFGANCPHPYMTDKFFHISAMSYGALSDPAVEALSSGAHMAGILMDTGEGGIAPEHLKGGGDLIAEIGTAKYGYRTSDGELDDSKLQQAAANPQVKMFSLKLGQGAKPGRGGVLLAAKVTAKVAAIRGIEQGKDSISPNRWPEIANVDELLDMIKRVRSVTAKPVGFKFAMGAKDWLEDLCQTIQKRGQECAPDFIIVDSADGGTGAGPVILMDYLGLRIREGLPILLDTLIKYGLRDRIKVGCSGKLITAGGVSWALAVGADFVNSARGFMFSLGCIQAMRCHKNTCPTGITTHKKHLQAGLDPALKKVKVMNYALNMHRQVGMIAHSCGVEDPRQLRRHHIHVMRDNGKSESFEALWPYPQSS